MPVSTLTSKGQLTVPKAVRSALGLQAGDKIEFVPIDGSFKIVALRKDIQMLKGRFAGRVAKPVSVEAMNEAIASEVPPVRHSAG